MSRSQPPIPPDFHIPIYLPRPLRWLNSLLHWRLLGKEKAQKQLNDWDLKQKDPNHPSPDQLNLSGLGERLGKSYLRNCNLRKSVFRNADLRHVDFGNSDLTEADFSYADLREADLSLTQGAPTALFYQADLRGAKLPADFLLQRFKAHREYLEQGQRQLPQHWQLDLSSLSRSQHHYLTNANLTNASLKGADLTGHAFGWANVKNADFTDADLTDADLSLVTNLTPSQLSGANLTRCQLPATVSVTEALGNVSTLSQNAGKMFLTVLLACVFVVLVSLTTPDIQLLANTGTAVLPALAISIPIPIKAFFGLAPVVLLVLSVTAHLYLQRLWEQMVKLPAIFPDGVTIDNKTYPWLVNDLVCTGFPHLRRAERRSPLSWLQISSFSLSCYGTVPLTIFWVFLRCLVRHDEALSTGHYWTLTLAVGWAFLVWYLNWITFRRRDVARHAFVHWWQVWNWPTYRSNLLFLLPALLVPLSTHWTSRGLERYGRTGMPLALSQQQAEMLKQINRYSPSPWLLTYSRINSSQNVDLSEMHKTAIVRAEKDLTALEQQARLLQTYFGLERFLEKSLWEKTVYFSPHYKTRKELSPFQQFFLSFPPLRPAYIEDDVSVLMDKWKEEAYPKYKDYASGVATLSKEEVSKNASRGVHLQLYWKIQREKNATYRSRVEIYVKPLVRSLSFRDTNLRFLQAHKAWLVNADFRGADLTGADFSEADLRGAKFKEGIDARPISLDFANLSNATLTGADLSRATLTGADLSRATLTGADLSNATLTGASLFGTTLTYADLSSATLTGADLSSVTLTNADLSSATLTGADLSSATLTGANLSNATLIGADLSNATLIGADLSGATLTGADLSGATLAGADLSRATLTGADLSKTNLKGAELAGLDLRMVKNLNQCDLDQVIFGKLLANKKYNIKLIVTQWPDGKIPSFMIDKDILTGKITVKNFYIQVPLTEFEIRKFFPGDNDGTKFLRASWGPQLWKLVRVPNSPKKSQ